MIRCLNPAIFGSKNLEQIQLNNNRLSEFDDEATNKQSLKYSELSTTLKHVDLSNNKGITDLTQIPRAFFAESQIYDLKLTNTGITKKMLTLTGWEYWGVEAYSERHSRRLD